MSGLVRRVKRGTSRIVPLVMTVYGAVPHAGRVVYFGLVGLIGTMATAMATDPPDLIPDTGTDVSAFVTEAIGKMALVAAVVVGGYFAFLIIKKGMSWARRAL